ncbi:queuosine precursor transporter [Bacillus sporothermodurans]|uniref:queuosine precursor transporter n=1 Tax=Heyndrickxia sporothermodurans TaxID=46224 RepID=UPI00192CBAF1|nr:queuosine precursor transporter [Heyndrickxia sporothermodurans]MBL5767761.1 queuosine precursor transporter [Heyndrickxia sporothermodurans]MBL5775961.1 queuosine precursor transporter [Heyndrickxia sporothermodurans]MBL5785637.1 queuosine precursor transporter [Heyndrickxia sporothermodurans]MBL5835666.1 queuosine precursor transporter [Heyndrickxia sporothermodurans]MBL5850265.1 queuosine precursor transporter [Heyndrickxia sporothermodurans]
MLLYLNGIFVGLLILSNIVAVKLFSIGDWAVLPAAVIIYIFTYPIVDTIVEVYGKDAGRKTVMAGLMTQMLAIIFITITIYLPSAPFFEHQTEYRTILSGGFRVIIASLVSYAVSQNLDVFVFNKLKERHGVKKLWLRNNASTMLSQLVDTAIFISIAFFDTMPVAALTALVFTQYVFKFLASITATPFVYLLVKIIRKNKINSISKEIEYLS